MPNTESEVIQTILKNGGKAKKRDIVKKLGVSSGYFDIIIRSLERKGLVRVNNNVYFLTSLGKKKLTESIQKTKKIELRAKKKRGCPRGKWCPKKQKADLPVAEVVGSVEPQRSVPDGTDLTKEPPAETLLGQRIGELKEKVAEAEKKIEEGVKNIEEKIEKELEKKSATVEEKAKPAVEKIEELPPIILQFGKFLSSVGKRIFNKCKKVKNIKFPKLYVFSIRQNIDKEKQLPRASSVFTKCKRF